MKKLTLPILLAALLLSAPTIAQPQPTVVYQGGEATTVLGTNAAVPASGYFNFGATYGTSGYGIRDNAGTIEIKDSGGAWAAAGGGGVPDGGLSDNAVPKFSNAGQELVDSLITDDGTDTTITSGILNLNSWLEFDTNITSTWPASGIVFGQRFASATMQTGAALANLASTGDFNVGISAGSAYQFNGPANFEFYRNASDGAGIIRAGNTTADSDAFIDFRSDTDDESNYIGGQIGVDFSEAAFELTAITAGTGADDISIVLTPAGTGRVNINSGESVQFALVHTSSDGSPALAFFQTTTRRGYLQQVDSGDNLYIASEYGPISFHTATNGSEALRMTIGSAGAITIEGLKTTGSAGSKNVVCVDTSTGQLYASSTGTDCSN